MSDFSHGFPRRLWRSTPEDALCGAVEAQRKSVWLSLWQRAIAERRMPTTTITSPAEQIGVEESTETKGDSNVIVAGFILSVPVEEGDASVESDSGAEQSVKGSERKYICVSLGSGSRCLAAHTAAASTPESLLQRSVELRDGHAEVMARRGLVAFLLEWADADKFAASTPSGGSLLRRCCDHECATGELTTSERLCWTLREDVEVHLVCSRWMCGSLAALAGGAGRSGHLLLRGCCGCWIQPTFEVAKRDEDVVEGTRMVTFVNTHVVATHYSPLNAAPSYVHGARVKPGKGRPNLTMSCTDKLWRWCTLGLQGRRRMSLFPVPILLSSVHVLEPSSVPPDERRAALANAIATMQCRSSTWAQLEGKGNSATASLRIPAFEFFTVSEYRAPSQEVSAEMEACNEIDDSSYSRCCWLTPLNRSQKRRHEDTEADADEEDTSQEILFTWAFPGSSRADHHRGTLVLNTKAGLPQGVTLGGLRRWCTGGRELPWQLFPLSRPWMVHRVEEVLHRSAAQLSSRDAIEANAPAAAATGETASCCNIRSHGFLGRCSASSLKEQLHSGHMEAVNHSMRFLWASSLSYGP